jgi:hypothetical protein
MHLKFIKLRHPLRMPHMARELGAGSDQDCETASRRQVKRRRRQSFDRWPLPTTKPPSPVAIPRGGNSATDGLRPDGWQRSCLEARRRGLEPVVWEREKGARLLVFWRAMLHSGGDLLALPIQTAKARNCELTDEIVISTSDKYASFTSTSPTSFVGS